MEFKSKSTMYTQDNIFAILSEGSPRGTLIINPEDCYRDVTDASRLGASTTRLDNLLSALWLVEITLYILWLQ